MSPAVQHTHKKIRISKLQVLIYMLLVAGLNAYLFSKYRPGRLDVKAIAFSTNFDRYEILVYPTSEQSFGVDFSQPIHPKPVSGVYTFDIQGKIRNFRIDLGDSASHGYIRDLKILYPDGEEALSLAQLKTDGVELKVGGDFSNRISAYFALPYSRITYSELLIVEALILVSALLFCMAAAYAIRRHLMPYIQWAQLRSLFVALFILLIFLPQPWFNAGFIVSFAWIVKDFSYRRFLRHTAGLMFLLYFSWFLLNNAMINTVFNARLLETLLPCFFLPFYVACLPKGRFLQFFPVAALLISLGLVASSLIDLAIFHNLNYFSFDGFTKYMHPVYFSYLLLFSLVYVELEPHQLFYKPLFVPVLAIALLCCGSKLMLCLVILFYTVRFFRQKVYLGLAFALLAICAALLFRPTRKRFQEIVNVKSFSILSEYPIASRHDPRLTGLTLRLIIWQESLSSFDGAKAILFGHGTDQMADHYLQDRLAKRQVEADHTKYDPHNQFIATFYKFGFTGLLLLLGICVYLFYLAIRHKQALLLCTAVLFVIAMCTESVLQRATGLYFFIAVILFQTFFITNPSYYLENSDPGNERNS